MFTIIIINIRVVYEIISIDIIILIYSFMWSNTLFYIWKIGTNFITTVCSHLLIINIFLVWKINFMHFFILTIVLIIIKINNFASVDMLKFTCFIYYNRFIIRLSSIIKWLLFRFHIYIDWIIHLNLSSFWYLLLILVKFI